MRIVTYSDPRRITDINGWEELCTYPQLCVSQTLVQGLSHKCGRLRFNVLTTVDKFLNEFYGEWKNNERLGLEQYLDVVNEIKKIKDCRIRNVFYKNKSEVIKSIKLLLESGIENDDFINDDNEEINNFKQIYNNLKKGANWNYFDYAKFKDIEAVKLAFTNILIDDLKSELMDLSEKYNINFSFNEISDISELKNRFDNIVLNNNNDKRSQRLTLRNNQWENKSFERIKKYFEYINSMSDSKISKIVFHGVHQFNPITIRVIRHLEDLGIEVIFLIQYNEEFKEIYKTWEEVYKWTNIQFTINNNNYKGAYKEIAEDYRNVLLGNFDKVKGNNCEFIKFDNMTEFTNYVGEIYENSKRDLRESGKIITKSKILANMNEQFYSVNGDMANSLLSVYFPEQFGEKHFLSYPIGQFILGLYDMWDFNENKMILKEDTLKECLSINLWSEELTMPPIQIYEKIRCYLLGVENVDKYIEYLNLLIEYKKKLSKPQNSKLKQNYEELSFFYLDIKEIEFFKSIIIDLKYISETLFGNNTNINLKDHYTKLMTILRDRSEQNPNISKEELEFVQNIFNRLKDNTSDINSSIDEVKNTLGYYLTIRQENNNSNWIVRDFQQIDGAIFLADEDSIESNDRMSIYHYSEVSDGNMNSSKKVELPWPLNKKVFKENNSETLDIVLTSKKEYSNFLKCTLFYGLYYLNRGLKISYIENSNDDQKETLYFPLRLIGNKIHQFTAINSISHVDKYPESNNKASNLIDYTKISKHEARMMSFCPYRYYYEGLIDGHGTYSTEFLSKTYIKTYYGLEIAHKINEYKLQNNSERKMDLINERIEKGIKLIPAWKRDFQDIKASIITMSNKIEGKLDLDYLEIKKEYIYMKFTNSDKSKIVNVEKCINTIEKNKNQDRIKKFIKYNKVDELQRNPCEEQCRYCKYNTICVYSYRNEVEN